MIPSYMQPTASSSWKSKFLKTKYDQSVEQSPPLNSAPSISRSSNKENITPRSSALKSSFRDSPNDSISPNHLFYTPEDYNHSNQNRPSNHRIDSMQSYYEPEQLQNTLRKSSEHFRKKFDILNESVDSPKSCDQSFQTCIHQFLEEFRVESKKWHSIVTAQQSAVNLHIQGIGVNLEHILVEKCERILEEKLTPIRQHLSNMDDHLVKLQLELLRRTTNHRPTQQTSSTDSSTVHDENSPQSSPSNIAPMSSQSRNGTKIGRFVRNVLGRKSIHHH